MHRRLHQSHYQIQIMNHQVVDDAHVGGAAREAAAAFGADVFRLQRQPLQRLEGRVEALDVADLEHQPATLGERDQLLRLGGFGRQRLLDQDGDAA